MTFKFVSKHTLAFVTIPQAKVGPLPIGGNARYYNTASENKDEQNCGVTMSGHDLSIFSQ